MSREVVDEVEFLELQGRVLALEDFILKRFPEYEFERCRECDGGGQVRGYYGYEACCCCDGRGGQYKLTAEIQEELEKRESKARIDRYKELKLRFGRTQKADKKKKLHQAMMDAWKNLTEDEQQKNVPPKL